MALFFQLWSSITKQQITTSWVFNFTSIVQLVTGCYPCVHEDYLYLVWSQMDILYSQFCIAGAAVQQCSATILLLIYSFFLWWNRMRIKWQTPADYCYLVIWLKWCSLLLEDIMSTKNKTSYITKKCVDNICMSCVMLPWWW